MKRGRGAGGFSLVEVVVAMAVIAVALLAALQIMVPGTTLKENARENVLARELASTDIESLKAAVRSNGLTYVGMNPAQPDYYTLVSYSLYGYMRNNWQGYYSNSSYGNGARTETFGTVANPYPHNPYSYSYFPTRYQASKPVPTTTLNFGEMTIDCDMANPLLYDVTIKVTWGSTRLEKRKTYTIRTLIGKP
jgi:prepilin-type N-terminal cleavage/methylation domain-containing protein